MSSALTKWSQDIIFKLATQRCLSIIWTAVVKGSQSPVKTAVFIFFFGNHKLNRTHFHKILRQGFHRLCQLNNGIFGDRVTQLFSCLSLLFKMLLLHSITCKVTWFVMSYTCVYVPCLLTPPRPLIIIQISGFKSVGRHWNISTITSFAFPVQCQCGKHILSEGWQNMIYLRGN